MNRVLAVTTLTLAAALLGGCPGVRVVKETRAGGELALLGPRDGAMEKARQVMAGRCGGSDSYEIVEQGEVPVGEVSRSDNESTTVDGRTRSGKNASKTRGSSTTETTQKTEWRVIYECTRRRGEAHVVRVAI